MADLYAALAEALSRPSKAYQAFEEGARGVTNTANALNEYDDRQELLRKRKLQQQSLMEALGGRTIPGTEPIQNVSMENLPVVSGLEKWRPDTGMSDWEKQAILDARQQRALEAAEKRHAATLGMMGRKLNEPKQEKKTEKDTAYELYKTAREGLVSGLEGSRTGPFVGRIPAVTEAQQTAEGGVSAMAPVLKQLFRVAGEGVFTDRDQALLLNMVPTRADHPEARRKKIANIDKIVRAKLGMPQENSKTYQKTAINAQGVRIGTNDDWATFEPVGAEQ